MVLCGRYSYSAVCSMSYSYGNITNKITDRSMTKLILIFTGMFYAMLIAFAAPVIITFRRVADLVERGEVK